MKDVLITSAGIQKNLRRFKPAESIAEYVWNGFDAGATEISINYIRNELDTIDGITITDNGTGIDFEQIHSKFQPYNDSDKFIPQDQSCHSSIPHGRNGVGRLTFFVFAESAKWDTVYCDSTGKNMQYSVTMLKNTLNKFDLNSNETSMPVETANPTGTTVVFSGVIISDEAEIENHLLSEFSWFLAINDYRKFTITINGKNLDWNKGVIWDDSAEICLEDGGRSANFSIRFLQWENSLGREYSKYYFMDGKHREVYKDNTTLNKKSDSYYHSVIIASAYFEQFSFGSVGVDQVSMWPNKSDKIYKELIKRVNTVLLSRRRVFLKENSSRYIDKLIDRNVYPEYDANSMIDNYKKQQLDSIVEALFTAEPKIFSGQSVEQQKVFIRLLDMIMSSNEKEGLFRIIKNVIELEDDDIHDLSRILEYTTLNNIAQTIKLLEDRVCAVQQLKEILFTKEFNALEVPHVQTIVEKHYWLFGEQYHLLTSTEPDFSEALRRLLYFTDGESGKVRVDHPDAQKEMDIFMIRQRKDWSYIENVVVELKRPSVKIGERQLSQVKRYMRVIQSNDRFNASNYRWTYFLIGNTFDNSGFIEGEIRSHQSYGDESLVHTDGNHKIYAMRWSELFNRFSIQHDFLLDKLKLSEKLWLEKHSSADEVVAAACNNSAALEAEQIPAAR